MLERIAMADSGHLFDLDQLLAAWNDKIYGLALQLTCRPDEAADLTQETFLRAVERRYQFRGEAEVGTWLYRICVNLWKNRVRAEQRRTFWHRFSLRRAADPPRDAPVESEPPPEVQLEADDRRRWLREALASLDPQDRAILVMRDVEDRSYDEISEWLEVPMGTVKSRLARTREKLKAAYERLAGGTSHE